MPTIAEARAWYPENDPVHGFDHVLRVYRMAERLAEAEGGDLEIVRAAVLLHDAQGRQDTREGGPAKNGDDQEARLNHHHASARFARQVLEAEGWEPERIAAVEHCIRAHRFRDGSEPPQTLEARILFDADKLDAIGAIGVARAVAYAARAGNPAYAEVSALFRERGQLEPGEAHSSYHEHLFKLRKLADRLYTPTARRIGAQRHSFLEAFYQRLAEEAGGEA